jgi:acetate kinase
MKILVLNCGSSSIKYKLFEMESKQVMAQGGVEKIGLADSFLLVKLPTGEKVKIEKPMPEFAGWLTAHKKGSVLR